MRTFHKPFYKMAYSNCCIRNRERVLQWIFLSNGDCLVPSFWTLTLQLSFPLFLFGLWVWRTCSVVFICICLCQADCTVYTSHLAHFQTFFPCCTGCSSLISIQWNLFTHSDGVYATVCGDVYLEDGSPFNETIQHFKYLLIWFLCAANTISATVSNHSALYLLAD